ncbi:sulfatase-like hydrolase/transferase [Croceivirga sp. JEA036]|uniref:sulfatase-like hydrolase/transferase n=1 Tax=Croceivirga sp. JEA036 TaxID=2721162 RepID=UPI001439C226|nr:sulfatase-like hydrolase/transferase [Croceivirga sp. JEA036]NJB35177.1 sulfatase-like hydrolase/transferase [Croceivirga sp. JEA036]
MRKQSVLFLVIVFLVISCKEKDTTQEKSKPNFIFLFADDYTYSAIHALGNSEIITPNLDRLVAEGTTFTHAYNMGAWNGAVCVASRSMMISGRSVWDAQKSYEGWKKDQDLEHTWGNYMKTAGYETYMGGKWHVTAKTQNVFDHVKNEKPGMPGDQWDHATMVNTFKSLPENVDPASVMPLGYNRPKNLNDTLWNPADPKHGGYWEGGTHWSELLKQDAVEFLEVAKEQEKPVFMYLAFNAPHDPRQAPQEFLDQYPLENITLPKSWQELHPDRAGMDNDYQLRDEALAPFPRTEYATKKHIQEYYALITHLDQQIGQIWKKVEESLDPNNTFIVFTADHGLAIGKHGLIGKQSLYDHSIRAPFIVYGPGVPKGKRVSTDIYIQDAMATALAIAGVEDTNQVFFNSVLPLAKGEKTTSNYPAIYGSYVNSQRMIRKDGFKLLVYPKLNKLLLFNMEADPEEMENLALEAAHQPKIDLLFKELQQLQKELGDTLDLTETYTTFKSNLAK